MYFSKILLKIYCKKYLINIKIVDFFSNSVHSISPGTETLGLIFSGLFGEIRAPLNVIVTYKNASIKNASLKNVSFFS